MRTPPFTGPIARVVALSVLAAALAGCVPEHPWIAGASDPWPAGAPAIDSLAAAGQTDVALALARRRLRLARIWREPEWRIAGAAALERSLARRAALPAADRDALAAADRALLAARSDLADDALAASAAHARAAWEARRRTLGDDDVQTAEAALALAETQSALAHVAAADSLARAARAAFATTLGAGDPRVADAEALLGRLVKNFTGNAAFPLALAHDDAALRRRVAAEGPTSLSAAASLQDLANLYRLARQDAVAFACFRAALEIRRARLGPVNDDVASTLGGMAFLCSGRGRWAETEALARQALAATPSGGGSSAGARAVRLGLLGQTLRRLDRNGEAVTALREAVALRESVWARMPQDEGSTMVAGLALHRDLAMALAGEGQGDAAFEQYARGTGRSLTQRLVASDAARPDPWQGLVPRVQATLADDEAMVAWARTSATLFVGDYPMWACVLRSRGAARWVRIDRRAPLCPPYGTIREALWTEITSAARWPLRVADTGEVGRLARSMYDEWFAPLEPSLTGIRHLVVCSPELFAGGPLGALQDGAGRWLAERYSISYTPSALLFVHARESARARRAPPPHGALLVGDPAFSPRDPGHWSRLAGAGDEIRAIAAHWPGATVLTGASASARRLRAMAASGALRRYALLHFATHTALDPVHVLESALVLAPETTGAADDSRLSAREVASGWTLDADLVCIAGCQSNLGASSSTDGLLGLQEAFLSAGARALLVSLWPVDDRATALLMQAFYARLADTAHPVDRATALREAQDALRAWRDPSGRRPFAHPAYWSAFALIGDPG